jgi:integrase
MMAEDALDLCKANGLAVDPQSADFRRLALAMLAGRIDATEKALQRQSGHLVTTPPLPSVTPSGGLPDSPKTIRDAVREYTASEGASPATALAYGTAANYFVSLHGDLAIGSVTKPQAAAFKAALQSAPARLSQQDRARPLRDVIAAYADRPDVPRIHARTVNQHVSALERVWDWAVAHGHARGDKNPFAGLRIKRAERAPAASAKPKEYSIGDLTRLFATPVFAAGERPSRGRGEAAYWLPLVALFTAARREEVAMLMVRDVARDADSGRWMLTIGDPTPHPTKGARRTKTGAQRTFPLPLALIRLGFLDHVEGMRAAGEQRLFPSLTITNARRQLGAKWGEWWSEYVKAAGISVSEPMHGFRHAWSTAARASGVPKDAREWIMGHAGDGRTNDQYGNRAALAHHMDAVRFAGLDLSHLERPGTEDRAAAYAW